MAGTSALQMDIFTPGQYSNSSLGPGNGCIFSWSSSRLSLKQQRRANSKLPPVASNLTDASLPAATSRAAEVAARPCRPLKVTSTRQSYLSEPSTGSLPREPEVGRSAPESEFGRLKEELHATKLKLQESEAELHETRARLRELELVRTGVDTEISSPRSPASTSLPSSISEHGTVHSTTQSSVSGSLHKVNGSASMALQTRGGITQYPDTLRRFWFPVAFSNHVDTTTMVPIECFEEPWVIFRGPDGKPGCLRDECAHRACPLSLGTVENGRVVCPYHGWEFSTKGMCEKMPSTKTTKATVTALPCIEHDGLIWIWPSKEAEPPKDLSGIFDLSTLPGTSPPSNYVVHAELVMELPVEHGLLVENLLDLAHAPFTHTGTFAKGWSVPNRVRFKTAASVLTGHWDPYPIDMEFRSPCVVVSQIGLAKPGQLEGGQTAADCSQHLFQMHACIPSSRGKTRLLYRMGLDFASWVKHVPFINRLWTYLAGQVLDEDLRLVLGQQDRMHRGGNVWNHPVGYDKLGVNYRRWRNNVEAGLVPAALKD